MSPRDNLYDKKKKKIRKTKSICRLLNLPSLSSVEFDHRVIKIKYIMNLSSVANLNFDTFFSRLVYYLGLIEE